MNRKLNFDKQKIKSLAEVSSNKALKILRMAVNGRVSLIYFLDKETYRVLAFKDIDALLASYPNSIQIYPDGKPVYFNEDSYIRNLIPEHTKILSPNNIFFIKNDSNDVAQKNDGALELCWKRNAVKVFKELKLDKSHLSLEQKAKKVEKEMQSRHSAGVKGMAKRGGKKAPSASTIQRHALQNI